MQGAPSIPGFGLLSEKVINDTSQESVLDGPHYINALAPDAAAVYD
jgi:hypothetical protein